MNSLLLLILLATPLAANAFELNAQFVPPKGWHFADAGILPEHVKVMVMGKGAHEVPPSINMGFENYNGTLSDYLKIVKEINKSQGDEWKDLGMIETKSGPASLSSVDMTTKWGLMRQMHLIFLKDGIIYILTAAALKDEFPKYYPEFFESIKSFELVEAKKIAKE